MTVAGDTGGAGAFAPGRRLLARLDAVQAPRRRTAAVVRERRRPKLLGASTRLARRAPAPEPPPLIPYSPPEASPPPGGWGPLMAPEFGAPAVEVARAAWVAPIVYAPRVDAAGGVEARPWRAKARPSRVEASLPRVEAARPRAEERLAGPGDTQPDFAISPPDAAANSPAGTADRQALGAEMPGGPILDSVPHAPAPVPPALQRASPAAVEWMMGGALPSSHAPSSGSLPSELVRSRERAARAELMRAAVPVRRGVVYEGSAPLTPPARGSASDSAVSPAPASGQPTSDRGADARGESSVASGTPPASISGHGHTSPSGLRAETVVMRAGVSPAQEVEPTERDVSSGEVARAPDLLVATAASPSPPESPDEPAPAPSEVRTGGRAGGGDRGESVLDGGGAPVSAPEVRTELRGGDHSQGVGRDSGAPAVARATSAAVAGTELREEAHGVAASAHAAEQAESPVVAIMDAEGPGGSVSTPGDSHATVSASNSRSDGVPAANGDATDPSPAGPAATSDPHPAPTANRVARDARPPVPGTAAVGSEATVAAAATDAHGTTTANHVARAPSPTATAVSATASRARDAIGEVAGQADEAAPLPLAPVELGPPNRSDVPAADASGEPDNAPAGTVAPPLTPTPRQAYAARAVARAGAPTVASAREFDTAPIGRAKLEFAEPPPTETPPTIAASAPTAASEPAGAGADMGSPTLIGSPADQSELADEGPPANAIPASTSAARSVARASASVVAPASVSRAATPGRRKAEGAERPPTKTPPTIAARAPIVSTSAGDTASAESGETKAHRPLSPTPAEPETAAGTRNELPLTAAGDPAQAGTANAIVARTSSSRVDSHAERVGVSNGSVVSREIEQTRPEPNSPVTDQGAAGGSSVARLSPDGGQSGPLLLATGVTGDTIPSSHAGSGPTRATDELPAATEDPASLGSAPDAVTVVARARSVRVAAAVEGDPVLIAGRERHDAHRSQPTTSAAAAASARATVLARPPLLRLAARPSARTDAHPGPPTHSAQPAQPAQPARVAQASASLAPATIEGFATRALPAAPPATFPPAAPAKLQRLTSRPQPSSRPALARQTAPANPRAAAQLAVARETFPSEPGPDAIADYSPPLLLSPSPTPSPPEPVTQTAPGPAADVDELFDALLERLRRELLLERERSGSLFGL